VVGTAANARDLVGMAGAYGPDVVVAGLRQSTDQHRRVLAVLTYLRA
jgi:hypothetical protein